MNITASATYKFAPNNTSVMQRSSASLQLQPDPSRGESFESWKGEIQQDLDHSAVLRKMLVQLAGHHDLPQAVQFEKIAIQGNGQTVTQELPSFGDGADIWDRRSVRLDNGAKAFDYVRRGHDDIRLLNMGQLI